jgi:aminobenzoyl-glutamate transport protein
MAESSSAPPAKKGFAQRGLDWMEWAGNKLPDPAVLFIWGLAITWALSWLLSGVSFTEIDPRTIDPNTNPTGSPIQIVNQLTGPALATFLSTMVKTFTEFHPLGVVLVALLGVGVAEAAGFIDACIKGLLSFTPKMLLTPMLILVGIVSHTAADAGYVLVIPLGGVIFYAAGRHPLAGIGAAFAGVSGGFSANFVPSGIDPLLSGLTQTGVDVLDPSHPVNPLCNWAFTSASCLVIILVGWFLTDRVIEPRLVHTAVDGDPEEMPKMQSLGPGEARACWIALGAMFVGAVALFLWAFPADSALRAENGSLTSYKPPAPLMNALVPLIFFFFLIPGVVYGFLAGTFKDHRDVIKGMSKAMGTMAYYLVMVFFAALFIEAFKTSNIGALLALKGAGFLKSLGAPDMITIVGIILLTAFVNLAVGSASAKWALLAPIFVPMLMSVGLSPELTQAAYRVGDSTTNIITPMMPYFPLVVVFAQRYVKGTGIGTITSLMFPYSIVFLILWTVFLLAYWQLGFPLGISAEYTYELPTAGS